MNQAIVILLGIKKNLQNHLHEIMYLTSNFVLKYLPPLKHDGIAPRHIVSGEKFCGIAYYITYWCL